VSGRRGGPHLRPVQVADRYASWWWLLVTVAVVISWRVLDAPAGHLRDAVPALLMVLLAIILSDLHPLVVSERREGVQLSWGFLFAVLLVWGLQAVLLGLAISTLVTAPVLRQRAHVALFNLAQWTLTYAATWWLLERLGWQPLAVRPDGFALPDLATVLAAGVLWYAVNTVLVGIAIALLEQRRVVAAITDDVAYFLPTTWAVLALAPVIIVLLEHDWRFLPFLLVPLSLVHHVASIAHEREQRALRDDLTGLGNRAMLVRGFEELASAGRGFAVCLLDLDRFKPINDTYGHAVGDEVLRLVAERLRSVLRKQDTAARLGGDEFAILLDVQGSDQVEDAALRIVDHLTQPYEVDGLHLEVGASYGVARSPAEGRSLGELLHVADAAMYATKRAVKP
jgi:diguanylate cyclase (GGDEF)-like protein